MVLNTYHSKLFGTPNLNGLLHSAFINLSSYIFVQSLHPSLASTKGKVCDYLISDSDATF